MYALGVEITVAALISSALIVLIGRWAVIPTWLLLIVLGNTSAGGAVAPLLPPFYAFVGQFLPPGATVNIMRTATYFRHDQHALLFVVQAVWLACALTTLLISARWLGRQPGRPAQ